MRWIWKTGVSSAMVLFPVKFPWGQSLPPDGGQPQPGIITEAS
jgi:hypothetical protein